MPKLIIETKTVADKAKVKKYLNKNEITFVKNDAMDGTTYFFVEQDHNISIDGATYTVKKVKTDVSVDDASEETIPMKQPECDVIENISESSVTTHFTNTKLAIYTAALVALVGIYVVLF